MMIVNILGMSNEHQDIQTTREMSMIHTTEQWDYDVNDITHGVNAMYVLST